MIELTPAQAYAIAEIAEHEGPLALHQVVHASGSLSADVFATPQGSSEGYRVGRDGTVARIGETLPAR